MNVKDVLDTLNEKYPLETQDEWDNSGLQLGSYSKVVEKALVTLDITREVVLEAVEQGVDLIISHHPLIYAPLKSINEESYKGRLLYTLIEHQITVVSLHTNFDKAAEGMNTCLLQRLSAKDIKSVEYDEYLRVGTIKRSTIKELLNEWKAVFPYNAFRYSGKDNALIETIGIIGGSFPGYELLDILIENQELDLFITGDTKSHQARYAKENGLNILDISHNNEVIFVEKICQDLEKNSVTCIPSKIDTEAYIYTF